MSTQITHLKILVSWGLYWGIFGGNCHIGRQAFSGHIGVARRETMMMVMMMMMMMMMIF